jgi:hypothetical protein
VAFKTRTSTGPIRLLHGRYELRDLGGVGDVTGECLGDSVRLSDFVYYLTCLPLAVQTVDRHGKAVLSEAHGDVTA